MSEKSVLRAEVQSKLRKMTENEISSQSHNLIEQLINSGLLESARCVAIYRHISGECHTAELIEYCLNSGRAVLLPRVKGDVIEMVLAGGDILQKNCEKSGCDTVETVVNATNNEFRTGRFGIMEPTGDTVNVFPNLIVVPLVAASLDGNRLGRGKGYYDRYLSQHAGITTVGLLLKPQLLDNIPVEQHDIILDYVLIAQ